MYYFFFYNRFCNYTCTENIHEMKSILKNPVLYFFNHCIVTLEIFWIKQFLINKTNIMTSKSSKLATCISFWWKLILPAVTYCNKEHHCSCDMVPGSTSDFSFFYESNTWWIFDNMPPWINIVIQDKNFFISSLFPTANVNCHVLTRRLPQLSCITRISIIL